ncbi:ABC transporter substrate-binding protein [Bauldia sp.]|uniref:ABC transporter substrate-binding protein n=1 Tax=Bauldia sp. TaxID=2575872 RepID=UPI003BA8ACD7
MKRKSSGRMTAPGMNRRYFLQVSAAGAVTATALGGSSFFPTPARAEDSITWISPRGTLEVLDDYPYWVGKEMGYFGDLNTVMEAGPSDGTATVKFVALGQADMGFPSPGVFSFAIENDMDLVSVFNMGAVDVFDFAFRPGEGVKSLKEMEGKTILLGSAAWQAITDPMLAAAGADISTITYLEGGWPQWGTVLATGQGDAALAWEGLRADWQGKGLEFEYLLGMDHSNFPANVFVVRRIDTEDPDRKALLEEYLRGWAMGLEFGHQNPRAAVQAVFNAFPIVKNNLGTELGTESMMQLAGVFRGNMEEREGWGWHDMAKWELFFNTLKEIGQTTKDVKIDEFITNAFIGPANDFDHAKVKADADAYELPEDMAAVDVAAIQARFFDNAIR